MSQGEFRMIFTTLKDDRTVEKPIITLDINLVVFEHPSTWPAALNGLIQLEYNYFEVKNIIFPCKHKQVLYLPYSCIAAWRSGATQIKLLRFR